MTPTPGNDTMRPEMDLRGRPLDLRVPRVMGILNLTPDSFFPGSRLSGIDAARRRAQAMIEAGADLLDLGAMSSRPGSEPVPVEEEIARLVPALEAVRRDTELPLSVDTYRPAVARAAVAAGADLLNDITGLRDSTELAAIAARDGLGLVVMHMRGTPRDMQRDTTYADVVGEVTGFLRDAVERACAAGVARHRVIVDPGIGFGKSLDGNLELMARLGELVALDQPVLVGVSRKAFIGQLLDRTVEERLHGSVGAAVAAVMRGAHLVRAHDVRQTVEAVRVAARIRDAAGPLVADGAGP
ncbi:MAG: dihydropteroate synthase [Candidatus Eiseniibacteriota bacterium]|jgi:dihydropteroate synthase